MATIIRYFISGNQQDLLNVLTPGTEYQLQNQSILVYGTATPNTLRAAPGVDLDARSLLGGEDTVIFSYPWANYTKDIKTIPGAIVFTYTDPVSGLTEKVTVLNGATVLGRDRLVFQDGSVISLNVRNALNQKIDASIESVLGYNQDINTNNLEIPLLGGNILRAFASTTDTNGAVFAMAEPGQTLIASGSQGVDRIYVKPGAVVNARMLLGSQDIIYFTGNWSEYTKNLSVVSGGIEFSRQVGGAKEVVTVLNGATTLGRDQLVFADGSVLTNNARTKLQSDLNVPISGVLGYDPLTITPFLSDVLDIKMNQEASTGLQNGWANAGDIIVIQLTMKSAVIVDTAGGSPLLSMNVGGNNKYAVYDAEKSSDTVLCFNLAIESGDNSLIGINLVQNPLSLNGATITVAATQVAARLSGVLASGEQSDYKVDTVLPVGLELPTTYQDDVGIIQSNSTVAKLTDDTTPGFLVQFPKNESGATAVLEIDGQEVAASYDPESKILTPKVPLTEGPHSIRYFVVDAAGNKSQTASIPIEVTVDIQPPLAAKAPVSYDDDVGSIQGVGSIAVTTDDRTPGIHVDLALEKAADLYVDGVKSKAIYDPENKTLTPTVSVKEGEHSFSYALIDESGNIGEQGPGMLITIDTTPVETPTTVFSEYQDDFGIFQYEVTSSKATDDTTPGFRITAMQDETLSLYVDNVKVESVYDPVLGTLTPKQALTEGVHSIAYSISDAAGNESGLSSELMLTIDTTPPGVPEAPKHYQDNVGWVTNDASIASRTDDATPGLIFTSSLEGLTPVLYVDGVKVESETSVLGKEFILTPKAPLPEGDHLLSFAVLDTVGNESTRSADFSITVDITSPATPAIPAGYEDNALPIVSDVSKMSVTNDATPGLLVDISSTDKHLLYVDQVLTEGTLDADKGLLTPDKPLNDGLHLLSYRLEDDVGNRSLMSPPVAVTVDTLAPSAPWLSLIADDGVSDHDFITTEGSIRVSGLGYNAKWQYSLDEGVSWVDGVGDTIVLTGLREYKVSARQTDDAGNVSLLSEMLHFNLVAAPKQTAVVNALEDDVGVRIGSITFNQTTDDVQPAASGTISTELNGSEVVGLYDVSSSGAMVRLGEAVTDKMLWHFTPNNPLGIGDHQITALVENSVLGLTSTAATPFPFVENNLILTDLADNFGASTGSVPEGGSSDDAFPVLSGSFSYPLPRNQKIGVYDAGTRIGAATFDNISQFWSFRPMKPLVLGIHTFTVALEEDTGTVLMLSDPRSFNNVSSVPTQTSVILSQASGDNVATNSSITGVLVPGRTTDDTTPSFSGTISANLSGQVLALYDLTANGQFSRLGNAVVSATSWTYSTPVLSSGSHSITAVVEDSTTGLAGPFSSAFDVNVVTSVSFSSLLDDFGSVVGPMSSGSITDDATPTFLGTLAAPIKTSEKLSVYSGATKLGEAQVVGSNWSFTLGNPLAVGSYSFVVKVEDSSNNILVASTAYPATIIAPSSAPVQTTTIGSQTTGDNTATNGSITGALLADRTTDDTTLNLSGTLSSGLLTGQVVAIYAFNGTTPVRLGTASVSSLNWSYTTPTLGSGLQNLCAVVEDSSSSLSGVFSNPFSVNVVPSITIASVMDDMGGVTGIVASSGVTDDTTPSLSGTFAAPLQTGEKVLIYNGTTSLGEASVSGTGWSFTPTGVGLADGTYSLIAKIEDSTKNVLVASSSYTMKVIAAPLAPSQTTTFLSQATGDNVSTNGSIVGTLLSSQSTDDATLNLMGTASAVLGTTQVIAVYDMFGGVLSRQGIASVSGTGWTYSTPTLSSGMHSLRAVVEDVASGMSGVVSDAFSVNIVSSVSITSVIDDVGSITGALSSGGTTDDASPTVSGVVAAALNPGEKVSIYNGTTKLGEVLISGTNWSFTNVAALPAGSYSFVAKVEDSNNNVLVASSGYSLVLVGAASAPTQTTTILSQTSGDNVSTNGSIIGTLFAGRTTDDTTLNLLGTLSDILKSGQVLAVYDSINGISTRLGALTPSTTSWSYTTPALASGSHSLTAVVEDVSANLSGPVSSAFSVNVVATASISSVLDDSGSVIGPIVSGSRTDDTTPSISGVLPAPLKLGEKISIYNSGVKLGEAKVDGTNWSFTPDNPLSDGTYLLIAKVEDAIGNALVVSSSYSLIESSKPIAPWQTSTIVSQSTGDNVGSNGSILGVLLSSQSTDDNTLNIMGFLSSPLEVSHVLAIYDKSNGMSTRLGVATISSGLGWTYITPGLSAGSHSLTAVVEDTVSGLSGVMSQAFVANVVSSISIISVLDDTGVLVGPVVAGSTTDDLTPTLLGTLAAPLLDGEKVVLYNAQVRLGEAWVSGTSWSFTPSTQIPAGTYNFMARVENTSGNLLVGSFNYALTLASGGSVPTETTNLIAQSIADNLATNGSITGPLSWGRTTDDQTLGFMGTLSGPLADGRLVAIYDGKYRLGYATMSGATNWTYSTGVLTSDLHDVTAVVEDSATGLQGSSSSIFRVNVVSSVSIASVIDDVGSFTGTVSSGGITDDTTPQLMGTLAAPIRPGEQLSIYNSGVKLGVAEVQDTSWIFQPNTPLSDGTYTFFARVEDLNGAVLVASGAYGISVFQTPLVPTQTTSLFSQSSGDNVSANGSRVGALIAVASTDDTTLNLMGVLSAPLQGSQIVVLYDSASFGKLRLGTATLVPGSNTWTYSTPALSSGLHKLTAVVEDASSGLASTASDVLPVNIVATMTIASISDDAGSVLGPVASGGTTDDSTPTLSGTLPGSLLSGEGVIVYGNGLRIGQAQVTGNNWVLVPPKSLSDGLYSLVAKVESSAGNVSVASAPYSVTIATSLMAPTAPNQTTTLLSQGTGDNVATNGSLVGGLVAGRTTDDNTLNLMGSLSAALLPGQVVSIYDEFVRLGSVSVPNATSWTYVTPALSAGLHKLRAVVEDTATGLSGTLSTTLAVNILSSLNISDVIDDVGAQTGPVSSGGVTDDTQPSIGGTLSASLGQGEKISIYSNLMKLGEAQIVGTRWVFSPQMPLKEGLYSLVAKVEDASNNVLVASVPYTLTINPYPVTPSQTVTFFSQAVGDDLNTRGSVVGVLTNGRTTDDSTLVFTGTLSSALALGQVLAIYDGTVPLGTATVSSGALSWTYATPTLSVGLHNLKAAIQDRVSGNLGPFSSVFSVNVVPSVWIDAIGDDVGINMGFVASGGSTDDKTPTIQGSFSSKLRANEKVSIYNGALKLGESVVSGMTWSFTPTNALSEGGYSFIAKVEDGANNALVVSNPYKLTISTPANGVPTQTVTLGSQATGDNVSTNNSVVGTLVAGRTTDDNTLNLMGVLSLPLQASQGVLVYDDGVLLGKAVVSGTSWTYTTAALPPGVHKLFAVVEDSSTGLAGLSSNPLVINIVSSVSITTIWDDFGGVTGFLSSGGFTDDVQPTLSGVIPAVLRSGEKLSIYNGSTKLGQAIVNSLNWEFTPTAVLSEGVYSLILKLEDANNNALVVSNAWGLNIVSSASIPTQTAIIQSQLLGDNVSTNGSITGSLISGRSTDDNTLGLVGTLSAPLFGDQVVGIYDAGKRLGSAAVVGTAWTYTTGAVSAGIHSFTANVESLVTGMKGSASSAFFSNVISVSITSITDDVGSSNGIVASGGTTDDSIPMVSGTLSAPLAVGEQLYVYQGDVLLGMADVKGNTWSFVPSSVLSDGSYAFIVRVQDSASNTLAASSAYTVSVLSTPALPTQTVSIWNAVDDNATNGSYVGTFPSNTTTDDTIPVLWGSLSAPLTDAQVVAIYEGSSRLGFASVSGTHWSYTASSAFAKGLHSVTAMVENAAGQKSASSAPFTFTLQATNISGAYINADGAKVGLANGSTTYSNNPSFQGSFVGVASNEEVAIYDTFNSEVALLGVAQISGTVWYFSPETPLLDGKHSFKAMIQPVGDTSGKTGYSVSTTTSITINSSTPYQKAIISGITDASKMNASITGLIPDGTTTDDSRPSIYGSLDSPLNAGESLVVYDVVHGLSTRLGVANTSGTGWNYVLQNLLSPGAHAIVSVVENDASGIQGPASLPQKFLLQHIVITGIADALGLQQGNLVVQGKTATDDPQPQLMGEVFVGLGQGEEIAVYNGTTKLGIAQLSGFKWFFTPSIPLPDGHYDFRVMVQPMGDTSGLAGRSVSDVVPLDINTKIPNQTAFISQVLDDVGGSNSMVGVLPDKVSTDDLQLELLGTLSAEISAGQVVAIYDSRSPGESVRLGMAQVAGTDWRFVTPELSTGGHSFRAVVVNEGNGMEGKASASPVHHIQAIVLSGILDNQGSVQGELLRMGQSMTDDVTPSISGTLASPLQSGEQVAVYDGSVKLGVAVVNKLNWSFTPNLPLSDGKYALTAMVQTSDATTNTGFAASKEILLSVVTPDVPKQTVSILSVLDDVATNGSTTGLAIAFGTTDDDQLVLQGKTSAPLTLGQRVVVYDQQGDQEPIALGQAVVDSGGNWSFVTPVLLDGVHSLSVRVEDLTNGLKGAATTRVQYVQTLSLSAILDDVGLVQGNLGPMGLDTTDDNMPTFLGNISAPLGAAEQIVLYNGEIRLGTATVVGSTWSYTPEGPLVDGTYALRAMIQTGGSTDTSAGRAVSNTTVLNINTKVPTQIPSITRVLDDVASNGSFNGALLNGFDTDDTQPHLSGILSAALLPGQVLAVYDRSPSGTMTRVGVARVTGTNWDFLTPTANVGMHTWCVVVENTGNNQQGPEAIWKQSIQTISLLTVDDNVGTVQGNLLLKGLAVSDDGTPTFSGWIATSVDASKAEIVLYNGSDQVGTAEVRDRAWSFTPSTPLPDGTYAIRAVLQSKEVGHPIFAASPTYAIVLAAKDPVQKAIITDVLDDVAEHGSAVGLVLNGKSSDDVLPTLMGSLDSELLSGQELVLYDTVAGRNSRIGVATVQGTHWTFTPETELSYQTHRFSARVENPATGKYSDFSNNYKLNLQNFSAVMIRDETGPIQGPLSFSTGRYVQAYTDQGTPQGSMMREIQVWAYVNGVLTNVAAHKPIDGYAYGYAGLPTGMTDENLVDAAGSYWASSNQERVQVDLGEEYQVIGVTVTGGHSPAFATRVVGVSSSSMSNMNMAGMQGNAGVQSVLSKGGFSGSNYYSFSAGSVTDDATPTVSGLILAEIGQNEGVFIYDVIHGKESKLGQAQVLADGSFSFTPSVPLEDGQHIFIVKIENTVDRPSSEDRYAISSSIAFSVDTSSVTQSVLIERVEDDVISSVSLLTPDYPSFTGALSSGMTTDDVSPVFRGSVTAPLRSSQVVALYDGDRRLGNAQLNGTDGTFSFSPANPDFPVGSHHVYARVENPGTGQYSLPSKTINLQVGTGFSMELESAVPQTLARYVAVYYPQTAYYHVKEIEIISNGVNIALNKWVNAGTANFHVYGNLPGLMTDGSELTAWHMGRYFYNDQSTGPNVWNYIDLGAVYNIDTINVVGLLGSVNGVTPRVLTFVSEPSVELTKSLSAAQAIATSESIMTIPESGVYYNKHLSFPSFSTALPILSGQIPIPLGEDEEVAIYEGNLFLGVALLSSDLKWIFFDDKLTLSEGAHTVRAVIQSVGERSGTNPHLLGPEKVIIVSSKTPSQLVSIESIQDDFDVSSTNAVYLGSETRESEVIVVDDQTPTLTGHLSASLALGQSLVLWDTVKGKTVRLGTAVVDGLNWSFSVPNTDLLGYGKHSIHGLVYDEASAQEGAPSGNVSLWVQQLAITGLSDSVGVRTGDLFSAPNHSARYVRISQGNNDYFDLSEIQVWAWKDGDFINVAKGKEVTSRYDTDAVSSADRLVLTDSRNDTVYRSLVKSTDNYFQLDLGGNYTISTVVLVPRFVDGTSYAARAENAYVSTSDNDSMLGKNLGDLLLDPTIVTRGISGAPVITGSVLPWNQTFSTDDGLPVISGRLVLEPSAGQVVSVYIDGSFSGQASVSGMSWSYPLKQAFIDGSHDVVVQLETEKGLVLASSADSTGVITLQVDHRTPQQSVQIKDVQDDSALGTLTGTVVNGATTDDAVINLSGAMSDVLSGAQVLAVYDTVNGTSMRLGTASVSGTDWKFSTKNISQGMHSFSARVENLANGTSTVYATPWVVNLQKVGLTGIIDDVGTYKGNLMAPGDWSRMNPVATNAFITDDTQPTLTGKLSGPLSRGEVLSIYDRDVWIGTGVVVPDYDAWAWTFAVPKVLTPGVHLFRGQIENSVAGGYAQALALSESVTLTVKNPQYSLPSLFVTELRDNAGVQKGIVYSGMTIDDAKPVLSGVLDGVLDGTQQVEIYDGNAIIGLAAVRGQSWSFVPTVALDFGAHQFSAAVYDISTGERGSQSVPVQFDLQAIRLLSVVDDAAPLSGNVLSGLVGTTNDTTPVLRGVLGHALPEGSVMRLYDYGTYLGEAHVYDDLQWDFAPKNLFMGVHRFTIQIENNDYANPITLSSEAYTLSVISNDPILSKISDYKFSIDGVYSTLDLTAMGGLGQPQQSRLDQVFLSDSNGGSSNTLKLSLDDVLLAGTNVFQSSAGWEGVSSEGRHQLLVAGSGGHVDVVGTGWVSAGTATFGEGHYLLFNHDTTAQLLIQDSLSRFGGVL